MVLPAHDFRSHVAWCARGVFLVFGSPYSSDTEICDAQVAVGVKNEVFRFDVSVDDALVVDVLEALNDAGGEEFGLEF